MSAEDQRSYEQEQSAREAYRAGQQDAARLILAEFDRIKGCIDEKMTDRKIAACQKVGLHMASLRVVELADRWDAETGGKD